MITLEIPERNLWLYLPEDLGECNKRQYIDMSSLIYRYNLGQITLEAFKIESFYKLIGLKKGKELPGSLELEKNSNIAMYSELIENFFEPSTEKDAAKTIKQYYTNNHIPYVCPKWINYYGPLDDFKNVCFGEYSDGLNMFIEYEKTKDDEYLGLLMSVFYRKKKRFNRLKRLSPKYNGDKREGYNEASIESRANQFKLLPKGELYGFYLYFASFHKFLTTSSIYLNGNEINIGLLFESSSSETSSSGLPGIGLKSLEYLISESGVFGTSAQVRRQPLWEILIRLYDIHKSSKDEKARMEAEKRKNKTS